MDKKEAMRERYYFYKNNGICVQCGQEKAAPGHVRCLACNANFKDYQKQKRREMDETKKAEHRKTAKERSAMSRKKRISEGLCPVCGKYKPEPGKYSCRRCALKRRADYFKKHTNQGNIPRSEWGGYGLCYDCGQPAERGKKLCSACLERQNKILVNARRIKKGNGNSESYQ